MTGYEAYRRDNKIAGKVLVSFDDAQIQEWAKECHKTQLYEPGRVCQHVFAGEAPILLMAYIPGIAWAMHHGNPSRFGKPQIRGSVYVHPDHRHQGIGRVISLTVWGAYKAMGL